MPNRSGSGKRRLRCKRKEKAWAEARQRRRRMTFCVAGGVRSSDDRERVADPSLDPVTVAVIECAAPDDDFPAPRRQPAERASLNGPAHARGEGRRLPERPHPRPLSRQVLLPDENKARLLALREQFLAELAPVGELETLLVERMIACAWRLRRLHRVERPCSKPSGGSSSRAIPPTRWSRPGHSAARWRRSTKARS